MQKSILLFLILTLFTCRHKKISKIWEFPRPDKSGLSFFSYGTEPSKDVVANIDSPPNWGPSLKTVEDKTCLYSHDDFFRSKEYGPSLGLCLETSSDNEALLKLAIETLNELDETKLRPDGFLKHEGAEAHLYFLSLTEIVNEISKSQSRLLFIGDNRLFAALEKRMDFSFEKYFSISGARENRFETSFSLPYFSIYKTDEAYKLVFPPNDSWTPRSQFHYLVIEFTNLTDFLSKFQNGFSNIQTINETWKEKCSKEKLEISEVMGYASGTTKRFIEWIGSKTNPTCLGSVNISITETTKILNLDSPFLFPGAVKLFIEEESPLQGIVLKDLNWKEIKSNSTLDIRHFDLADTWKLPESVKFNWVLDEFSLKRKQSNCEWSNVITLNSKFCGDPGIEFAETLVAINPNDNTTPTTGNTPPLENCKPEEFTLSELNAYGLRPETTIDKSGKFIELQFIGAKDCKLMDLSLVVGEISIPLFGKEMILKSNSYLVITDGKHFSDLKNLIPRNIDFLGWQNSIEIKNTSSTKVLWNGLRVEDFFLSQSMSGVISSMVFKSGTISHHPLHSPIFLQSIYRISHSMSPGEPNGEIVNTATGEISEILWAGAYKNSISIPDDKFIELKTKGEGTLELEINAGTKISKFYFPVSKLDAFTVLSRSPFQCFPETRSILSTELNLSNEITNLKLKSSENTIGEITYNPTIGHGLNNSSQKIRASVVNSGVNSVLRTSIRSTNNSVHSECKDQTYASPDRPNEFEPFLVDESFDYLGNGKFYLAASYLDIHLPFNAKVYSHLPLEHFSIPLEKLGITNLLKPIGNFLQTTGLVYQRLENYSDLKIYNRDGIFIEGIMTNPTNAQNEWILLCNRSYLAKDITEYEIEDEDSVDQIDSYFKRKKIQLPTGVSSEFSGNSTLLSPGQCGYLVDPDASKLNLKLMGISPTLIFTTRSTSTIGNGISSGEMLDLYKTSGGQRTHIHSFGNKYSHAPFIIPVNTDEIILLSPEKRGENKYDYEVVKW